MKVLVTGGAGYIGTVVISFLLEQGFQVRSFDKHLFGSESLLAFPSKRFQMFHGDICDREALQEAMNGVDAIVHLAALVGENACSLDEEATRNINLLGTEQCLSLAETCGVKRLIFLSTCSNYGVHSSNELAHEASPLNPLSSYAETKVASEKIVLNNPSEVTTTVLRFGTICGLSPRMRFDLLVNDMARAVACNELIQIYSPEAWRPFLHINDAARVIAHCLKAETQHVNQKVFNAISENYQKTDLMKLVQKHFPETDIEVIEKKADLRDYRVSAEKIHQELNFTPVYTVEQAFLEVVHAVRERVFFDPSSPRFTSVPNQNDLRKELWSKS